jgi:hypothetical protein
VAAAMSAILFSLILLQKLMDRINYYTID